jgi:hypothetical protein
MLTSDTQLIVNEYAELEEVCIEHVLRHNWEETYFYIGPHRYLAEEWSLPTHQDLQDLESRRCRFCSTGAEET